MLRHTYIFLALLLPLCSKAQSHVNYVFENLTVPDGLSSNSISAVIQDRQGMIWLATQSGIDKYVNGHFRYYSHVEKRLIENVTMLYDWDEEHILVATESDNLLVDKWRKDSIPKKLNNALKGIIFIDRLPNERFIVFTEYGISITDAQLKPQKDVLWEGGTIYQVAQHGDKCFVAAKTGLWIFDKATQKTSSRKDSSTIKALFVDATRNRLYFATGSNTIYIYDTEKEVKIDSISVFEGKQLTTANVTAIFVAGNSLLWVGSQNGGLYLYDLAKKSLLFNFSSDNPTADPLHFSSNQINCLYGSKEGVVWVGSENGGLNLWQPGKLVFQHLLSESVTTDANRRMKKIVWSIYAEPNSDKVWVGLDKEGIACLSMDDAKYLRQFRSSEANNPSIFVLRAHKGKLYIGTNNGIYQMPLSSLGNKYTPLRLGNRHVLEGNRISILTFDSGKSCWYAGRRQKGVVYELSEQFDLIDSFLIKDNKLSFVCPSIYGTWVGTFNGLYRIAPNTNTAQEAYKEAGMAIHFTCALVSGNKLWAGTDRKGLYVFDIASDGRIIYSKCYNDKNGFPFEVIYEMQKDTLGYIWLSTNHGLYRFDTFSESFNYYGHRHGLHVLEFNSGAIFPKKDILFFGGVGDLCYFNAMYPSDTTAPYFKPILEVKYYGKKPEYQTFDYNISKDYRLLLPYKFGYIDLRPVLGQYHDPDNNRFVIRLNGSILPPQEDGRYIIEETKIRSTFLGSGRKNSITIQYRTGNGLWQEVDKLVVSREYFNDSANWLIFPLLLFLSLSFYLIYRYYRNSQKLNRLHIKINELSKEDETQKICFLALSHLTKDLGYDYATIALVDFDQKRIKTSYIEDSSINTEQKELWKKRSDYTLSSEDILAQVARLGKPVIVIGNKYVSHSEIQDYPKLYNSEIANDLQHENVARIFIPFIHQLPNDDGFLQGEQVVLGVVEAGYRMSRFNRFFIARNMTWLLPAYGNLNVEGLVKNNKIYLRLYMDNLAHPYFKAFIKEEKRKIYDFVEKDLENFSNEKEEDSNAFLKRALATVVARVNAEAGDVALSSFSTESPDYNNNDIDYGVDYRDEQKHIIQTEVYRNHFTKVLKTHTRYYNNKIQILDTYKSILLLPMALHQSAPLVGVFTLMSYKPNFFNPVLAEVYQQAVRKITDVYLQKKRYEALQKIAQPLNQVSQTQESLYKELAHALGAYFNSNYIGIWVRKSPESLQFNLSTATEPSIYKLYNELGFTTKEVNIHEEREFLYAQKEILSIQVAAHHPPGSRIRTFCEKNGFVSYILLKIIRDDRYQAMINIFSKRLIHKDEISGYSKSLLEEAAHIAAIEGGRINLFESFRAIAESLTTGQEDSTLKKIVEQAYLMAPSADSVVLFPYKQDSIRIKDAVVGGVHLPQEDQQEPDKKANLANYIIDFGTHYFNDEKSYTQIARKTDKEFPERDTFWIKRGLQSVAAIRMEYEGKPVGVMIYNYTEKKSFEESDRQNIEAFANYATIALINENYIQQIRDESILLSERIQRLAEQEKAANKEVEKLHEDMKGQEALLQKISDKAAGESFYVILQGINHDIRNHLLSMEGLLESYLEKIKDPNDREDFEGLLDSLNQQSDTIGALLILFKPSEVIKREAFDISDTILKVTQIFSGSQQSLIFNKDFGENIPELICNRTEFSMVIYNLIKNAVTAIEKRGQEKGEITLSTRFENKHFIIKVADNGAGIDNALQEKIFDLGYTTTSEGTGVGLYFVKKTVENRWEGRIRLASQKGKGATFILEVHESINFKN